MQHRRRRSAASSAYPKPAHRAGAPHPRPCAATTSRTNCVEAHRPSGGRAGAGCCSSAVERRAVGDTRSKTSPCRARRRRVLRPRRDRAHVADWGGDADGAAVRRSCAAPPGRVDAALRAAQGKSPHAPPDWLSMKTPVPVLDPGRGQTKTGYFWGDRARHGPGRNRPAVKSKLAGKLAGGILCGCNSANGLWRAGNQHRWTSGCPLHSAREKS